MICNPVVKKRQIQTQKLCENVLQREKERGRERLSRERKLVMTGDSREAERESKGGADVHDRLHFSSVEIQLREDRERWWMLNSYGG